MYNFYKHTNAQTLEHMCSRGRLPSKTNTDPNVMN